MTSREQFEAWITAEAARDNRVIRIVRERDWYAGRDKHFLNTSWSAWQASRESPEQSSLSHEVRAMLKQFEIDEGAEMQRAETFIRETGRASISAMQRNFKIGYERACRLMDKMVERGVVSAIDSEGRRSVLPEVKP